MNATDRDRLVLKAMDDEELIWDRGQTSLNELLDTMATATGASDETALDDDAIPAALFSEPGVEVSPQQIQRSLRMLARNPPDYVPEDWADWLRWLGRAAQAGGCRSVSPSRQG